MKSWWSLNENPRLREVGANDSSHDVYVPSTHLVGNEKKDGISSCNNPSRALIYGPEVKEWKEVRGSNSTVGVAFGEELPSWVLDEARKK